LHNCFEIATHYRWSVRIEQAKFQPNFVFALSMTESDLGQVIAYKKKTCTQNMQISKYNE